MRLRTLDELESMAPFGIANGELRPKVMPLVHELTARNGDVIGTPRAADLPRGKRIAATRRFGMNAAKVLGDRAARRGLRAKPVQLRVMHVALRSAPQYSLRQQRLTPEGNESAGVKILWMYGPETHGSVLR